MLVPLPQSFKPTGSHFSLAHDAGVAAVPEAQPAADFLVRTLRGSTGFALPVGDPSNASVVFQRSGTGLAAEGYLLEVTAEQVVVSASSPAGFFYGAVSLLQLFPPEVFSQNVQQLEWQIQTAQIEDHPRFGWRGFMLDVSRHFMPVEFIKRVLDLMALHKLNTFHWHLTDDQGWRIEILKHPRLTEVGAWRRNTLVGHGDVHPRVFDDVPHGGFYTQQDIREVVQYALDRHITVVPEIDLPGHMQAAIAAYPELGNTGLQLEVCNFWGVIEHVLNPSEETLRFLEDVFTEVLDLFPSRYICVGGDECVKKEWRESAAAQQRMRDLGLSTEEELQSHIIRHMDRFLHERGRKLLGWDEILEGGLSPNATVLSWRGEKGGIQAARAGHDVVMVPQGFLYLDHYQTGDPAGEPLAIGGQNTLERVYSYNPVGWATSAEEKGHVLGTQANLWTEYVKTPEHAQYMMFPRLCALSEIAWTPLEQQAYPDFLERLRMHLQRLDHLGVKYRPLDGR